MMVAAVAATAVIVPAAPASAQGLFDFLFGSPRRPGPPPNARSYADPYPGFSGDGERRPAPAGTAGTFCVRLCDGRYFPLQRNGGTNPAQLCNAFCPAAETRMFSGAGIDHAVANDGTRYASLRNAFAYRERMVENCTCNGRDPYGLVSLDATEDASLRAGDIVGEHTVQFTTDGERIELIHRATNRDIFARGALAAAVWLSGRQPGRYALEDLFD